MPSPFVLEVTLEHGQLHEHLADEADRQEMINRLEAILLGPGGPGSVRDGVVQILIDQLRSNNAHEPIIIHTGDEPGDVEEQIVWESKIVKVDDNTKQKQDVEIQVKVGKYRDTQKTPRTSKPDNPFKFTNNQAKRVESLGQKSRADTKHQKFYKFEIEADNPLAGFPKLKLDPCIICDK